MMGEEQKKTYAGQKHSDGFQIGCKHRQLDLGKEKALVGFLHTAYIYILAYSGLVALQNTACNLHGHFNLLYYFVIIYYYCYFWGNFTEYIEGY